MSPTALFEWNLPDWLTVIGFPGVAVGLVLAWRQARSATESADAATAAIRRTERRLADNHLLVLIPQVQQLSDDLEAAAVAGARSRTIRYLSAWLRLASELQGLLEAADARDAELLAALERSTFLTGRAKNAVIGEQQELEPATRELRDSIGTIYARSSKMLGRMRAFTGSSEDD